MSWIVQSLLSNREKIRNKSSHFQKEYQNFSFVPSETFNDDGNSPINGVDGDGNDIEYHLAYGYEDPQITSEEFTDLLDVEKAVDKLTDKEEFNSEELEALEFYMNSKSDKERPNQERHTLSTNFVKVCQKVAIYLGGYFTDEGYLNYMREKHNLNPEQLESASNFIKSKYRHPRVRKPKDG